MKKVKLAIPFYFNLVNLSLKELAVSLEDKNLVINKQNPFVNHQHGKSQRTVNSEDIDDN